MNNIEHPNLAGLIVSGDPETLEQARQRTIEEVMTEHQVVSSAWSLIDGPFAQPHSVADHEIALDEYRALIGRVVHLPQSVEGIRFLESWFDHRMKQLGELREGAKAGNEVQWSTRDGNAPRSLVLTEDMAKGIRMALAVVESLFEKFPLQLSVGEPLDGD